MSELGKIKTGVGDLPVFPTDLVPDSPLRTFVKDVTFGENWDYDSWSEAPYSNKETTIDSVSGSVLRVTSTNGDPWITMFNIGSFNPNVYEVIEISYRVTNGTAGSAQIFFANDQYSGANGEQSVSEGLTSDGNWHVAKIDMSKNANWTHSNVTGWRYDWCNRNACTMEIDYIRLVAKDLTVGSFNLVGTTNVEASSVRLRTSNGVKSVGKSGNFTNVYVSTSDGYIKKFDAIGNQMWSVSVGWSIKDLQVDNEENVYVTGLYAIVAKYDKDGNNVWTYNDGDSSDYYGTCLAIDRSGQVYIGRTNSRYRLIKADGSGLVSEGNTGESLDMKGASVHDDGTPTFFVADPDYLHAYYSGVNGLGFKFTKSLENGGNNTLVIATDENGNTYVAMSSGYLMKFDIDGVEQFSKEVTFNINSGLAVDKSHVYVGSWDGSVTKLDTNGNEVWKYIGTGDITKVSVDKEGNIYAGKDDGTLFQLTPEGDLVWEKNAHSNGMTGVAVPPGRIGSFSSEW